MRQNPDSEFGWPKKMLVDKRIVTLLSRKTYDDFAGAIRELVSNAYDAGSRRVDISLDLKKRRLVVSDDGIGMSPADFQRYLTVGARPMDRPGAPLLGRVRIGQFGIGFLAVVPFCETMRIETTVQNSDVVIEAELPAHKYGELKPLPGDIQEIGTIDIPGREIQVSNRRAESGTKITLEGLTDLALAYFGPHKAARAYSIRQNGGVEKLTWELQQYLPLEHWPDSDAGKYLAYEPTPVPLHVYLNGAKLHRNLPTGVVLEQGREKLTESDDSVEFKFALLHNWKPVKPEEARGIQFRVRNVGIGLPTYLGLGVGGKVFSRLTWIFGEVQVLEGLDEALSISRDSFVWTKLYEKFEKFVRDRIQHHAMQIEAADYRMRELEREKAGKRRYASRRHNGLVSKKTIIEENLAGLKQQGYEVVRKRTSSTREEPLSVDRAAKRVTVVDNHPDWLERVNVGPKTYTVSIGSWPADDTSNPACRLKGPHHVEFNRSHPAFSGQWDVEVAKKVYVVLAEAKQEYGHAADRVLEYINRRLIEAFKG